MFLSQILSVRQAAVMVAALIFIPLVRDFRMKRTTLTRSFFQFFEGGIWHVSPPRLHDRPCDRNMKVVLGHTQLDLL
jgi:hypothetical protein